jgi:uncharacterized protein YuzE
MKVKYGREDDALYITLNEDAEVSRTLRIDPGTLVDLDRFGNVRGIEVLRPGRQWPLEQILSQCTVSEVDALLLRELQSSTEFRRYAFAPPVQVA